MTTGGYCMAGIRCDDFVLMAADKSVVAHGVLKFADDIDRGFKLGEKLFMYCAGSNGSSERFGAFARSHVDSTKIQFGYELKPEPLHHFLSRTVAADSWSVDLLLGGFNDVEGKSFLGSVDKTGAGLKDWPYAALGDSAPHCKLIMNQAYRRDMSEAQAIELLQRCVNAAKRSFSMGSSFSVVKIDRSGVQQLADLS